MKRKTRGKGEEVLALIIADSEEDEMDKNSYEGKLTQLIEIFQGDEEYARVVLDKWLQKNRSGFEAEIIAEISRRLEGLNSIVPVTLKVLIDSNGVQLPGAATPQTAKPEILKEKRAGGS